MEVQMIIEELRYVILVDSQMVIFMVILGKFRWEGYLVQIVELREAPPVGFQMVYLIETPLMVSQYVVSRSRGGYPYVSDVVFSYAYKVSVWARHVVVIFISSNHEVFPDFIDILCGYVYWDIISE